MKLRRTPPSDPEESPVSPEENTVFPLMGEQSAKRESEDEESARKRARGVEDAKEEDKEKDQEELSEDIDDDDEDAAGEEERDYRGAKAVTEPTAEEMERHRRTHIPYRVWCRWCLMAKAKDRAHHKVVRTKDGVPLLCMDFFFIGEGVGNPTVPAVSLKDSKSKALFAHVIPGRGIEYDWPAKQLSANIKGLGYRRVVLRCDNEPAIVAMAEAVKAKCPVEIVIETSPPGDKNANGIAERSVQATEAHVRTLKADLESRINAKNPVEHPVVAWMVRHAADLITKLEIKRATGRTAYEQLKGRTYKGDITDFGRQVMFMKPSSRGGDVEPRWAEGTWIGKRMRSDEHMIYSEDKIHRARHIKLLPPSESWSSAKIEEIKATQWK